MVVVTQCFLPHVGMLCLPTLIICSSQKRCVVAGNVGRKRSVMETKLTMHRVLKMKLLTFLFLFSATAFSQEKGYGERDGNDWKGFYHNAELLFSNVNWVNKQEWIDVVARQQKMNYILAIYDLSAYWSPYVTYEGSTCYNYQTAIANTSPLQMVEALDKFYSDYRNLNIKILHAIPVCRMDLTGSDSEGLDWWTRYLRGDETRRLEMIKEKYRSSTRRK
jgi:hypothetical protein